MSSLPERLYGTDEAVAPVRVLRAGPLAVELQRERLRSIRWGDQEVWHGLALVLRDVHWGTPEPTIDDIELREGAEAFEVQVRGRFPGPLSFRLHITGRADGHLRVDAEAVPGADLQVNRFGLCLLHPRAVRGVPVEVTHVDGRLSASTFPQTIPPWPPFMLVRSLRHQWAPHRWASATLEGDVFETEDQRNNADASFKTYSRSNMAPRPYRLGAGVPVRQSATLLVEDRLPLPRAEPSPLSVSLRADEQAPWPAVGIEIHAEDARMSTLTAMLAELRPAHLHLAWRPGLDVHWPGVASMLEAAGCGFRLDAQLAENDDATGLLRTLRFDLDAAGIACECLAVFPSHHANVAAARAVFPGIALGGGTPHFFVQLSRLDALAAVDFASFTTASVVHGADDDEVMLGLTSLPDLVESWRARQPGLPLRVGPSGIAARASPLGAQPPSDGRRRLALAKTDPRSRAQFGAAWALGHVAGLAQAGVQAVSLLSLCGAAGLLSVEAGIVRHRPAFHVLARLGPPARRVVAEVSDAQRIAALALWREGRLGVLVANLRGEPAEVQVSGLPAASTLQMLDAEPDAPPTWRVAGSVAGLIRLAAYAVAWIESPGR